MNPYYDDFSQLSLTTHIIDQKDDYYAFEATVFYGEKGGMPSDRGWINGQPVLDLKYIGDTLYHQVQASLEDPIQLEVEPKTRWLNTAAQSSFHLLDGFYRQKGLELIAIGTDPDHLWYEVNQKDLSTDLLDECQAFMQAIIRQEIPCEIRYIKGADYPDPAYQHHDTLRIVRFGDVDCQPCATLHVNHTGQIGSYCHLSARNSSRGSKVTLTLNQATEKALETYYQQANHLSQILNAPVDQLDQAVQDLIHKEKASAKVAADLKAQVISYQAQALAKTKQQVYALSDSESQDLRQLSQALIKFIDQDCLVYHQDSDKLQFALLSPQGRARDLLKVLQSSNPSIKGGGSPQLVSGRMEGQAQSLIDHFQALIQPEN